MQSHEVTRVVQKDLDRLDEEHSFYHYSRINWHRHAIGLESNIGFGVSNEQRHQLLLQMLLVFAKEHPQPGYQQGMHEICSLLLLVLEMDLFEAETNPQNDNNNNNNNNNDEANQNDYEGFWDDDYLLHDTYTLFEAVMEGMVQAYGGISSSSSTTTSKTPIEEMGQAIVNSLRHVECNDMDNNQQLLYYKIKFGAHGMLRPEIYCTRWIRLLFSREVAGGWRTVLRLWDVFFDCTTLSLSTAERNREPDGSSSSSSLLPPRRFTLLRVLEVTAACRIWLQRDLFEKSPTPQDAFVEMNCGPPLADMALLISTLLRSLRRIQTATGVFPTTTTTLVQKPNSPASSPLVRKTKHFTSNLMDGLLFRKPSPQSVTPILQTAFTSDFTSNHAATSATRGTNPNRKFVDLSAPTSHTGNTTTTTSMMLSSLLFASSKSTDNNNNNNIDGLPHKKPTLHRTISVPRSIGSVPVVATASQDPRNKDASDPGLLWPQHAGAVATNHVDGNHHQHRQVRRRSTLDHNAKLFFGSSNNSNDCRTASKGEDHNGGVCKLQGDDLGEDQATVPTEEELSHGSCTNDADGSAAVMSNDGDHDDDDDDDENNNNHNVDMTLMDNVNAADDTDFQRRCHASDSCLDVEFVDRSAFRRGVANRRTSRSYLDDESTTDGCDGEDDDNHLDLLARDNNNSHQQTVAATAPSLILPATAGGRQGVLHRQSSFTSMILQSLLGYGNQEYRRQQSKNNNNNNTFVESQEELESPPETPESVSWMEHHPDLVTSSDSNQFPLDVPQDGMTPTNPSSQVGNVSTDDASDDDDDDSVDTPPRKERLNKRVGKPVRSRSHSPTRVAVMKSLLVSPCAEPEDGLFDSILTFAESNSTDFGVC